MTVNFENNSVQLLKTMDKCIEAFLHEAGGELKSQVARNTAVDTGDTKNSWDYTVDTGEKKATVGSPMQNAIWEEYGTGEYAAAGNGRKSSWVYKSNKDGKFHRTKGKKPRRPFERAFTTFKPKIQRFLESKLKEMGK